VINALQMLKSPLQTPGPIEKAAPPSANRAGLVAFAMDGDSEASLAACFAQLAVPTPMIKRGGLAGAIRYLGTERSPESIIVDISGAEMPASQIHDLADLCEPGVVVIAIGDQNDVALYRDLVRAGVSEYIVKPVTAQLLAKAFTGTPHAGERPPISRKLGKVVAVVGARGGVGATTLAIHLGLHLANQQNRRVMLLDLDLHTGDCALALNLKPTPGLREALVNPLRIDSVFLERTMAVYGERLFVLSAEEPLRAAADFTAAAVDTLLGTLRTQFHYIITDIPRISIAPYWQALDTADIRIVVADQTLRSVRDAVRLREGFGAHRAEHSNMLIVNRSGEGGRRAMTLEEMARVKLTPNFVIPFRPSQFTALGPSRSGAFTNVIAALAGEISGRAVGRKPWWRFATK
jgi:pilus assembly protein CpaE